MNTNNGNVAFLVFLCLLLAAVEFYCGAMWGMSHQKAHDQHVQITITQTK